MGEIGESTLAPEDRELDRFFERTLVDTLGAATYEDEHARGKTMTLDETIELARWLVKRSAAAPAAEQAPTV